MGKAKPTWKPIAPGVWELKLGGWRNTIVRTRTGRFRWKAVHTVPATSTEDERTDVYEGEESSMVDAQHEMQKLKQPELFGGPR